MPFEILALHGDTWQIDATVNKKSDPIPIYNLPKRRNVLGATVVVIEVVGVLPDVDPQNGKHRHASPPVHEGVILVLCSHYDQLLVLGHA